MNIYKGVCLGFGVWVQELYEVDSKDIPEDIQDRVKMVWKKVLEHP